jgi:hypothetical protein
MPPATLSRFVRGADDRTLERIFASGPALRLLFAAAARRYDPSKSRGFAGELQCDVRTGSGAVRSWTVAVDRERARARPGAAEAPAVVISASGADLVRMAAGELDTGRALLSGKLDVRGDFRLVMRLGAMFGGGS